MFSDTITNLLAYSAAPLRQLFIVIHNLQKVQDNFK